MDRRISVCCKFAVQLFQTVKTHACPLFQIPGLVVWSSALPESTGFLRQKCYRLKRFFESGVITKETLIEHCGFDSIHATKAAMSNAVSMLFAELCAADLDLATVQDRDTNETVRLPICCSRLGDPEGM